MLSTIKKAVIPAAGLGSRFLPVTKAIPKEMLPIIDRPTIHYIVQEAVNCGIEQIIIVNGRNKSSIENYFDRNIELESALQKSGKIKEVEKLKALSSQVEIISIRQKEPLGLGHAVWCAKNIIGNDPFAVLLGDDLTLQNSDEDMPVIGQLIKAYEKTNKSQIALTPVPLEDTSKYGIAVGNRGLHNDRYFNVSKLVEKPKYGEVDSNYAIIGRYVLSGIWEFLDKQQMGAGGEIQLTDALSGLVDRGSLQGYCFLGQRIDAGDKLGYLKANLLEGLRRKEFKNDLMAIMAEILKNN